jgi:hypothetical protein
LRASEIIEIALRLAVFDAESLRVAGSRGVRVADQRDVPAFGERAHAEPESCATALAAARSASAQSASFTAV